VRGNTTRCGVLLALGAFGFAAAAPEGPLGPGTHKVVTDVRVGGIRRSYLVHVPPGHDGTTPLPVLVALHGAFSGARRLEAESGFSRLADREGFVVVYPNGIGLFSLFRHWNSGHCCGKARRMGLDDVGFVLDVVAEVAQRVPLDLQRLYLTGHSNGGMLAHRIAAERAESIAALAVVSGTIGGRPSPDEPEWVLPAPRGAVPVLLIHGRADEHVPYDGGRGRQSKGKSSTISVERSVGLWTAADGCSGAPGIERSLDGRVERKRWGDCTSGAEVELVTLEGWGHDWPGGRHLARLPADDPLRGFDAAGAIWSFLTRQRKAR